MPEANDQEGTEVDQKQVGGTHYKTGSKNLPQHWDVMWYKYREAWFIGSITKYLWRYRKKNGVADLEKAKHYLEKLIELETLQTPSEKD